jgi:UDP-glucuronate decarboxylase
MIRWITERLGTAAWSPAHLPPDVSYIDVRDLLDQAGNAAGAVRSKIDQALNYLRRGERVVVCCDFGMSRSNAIAAGILAIHDAISLEEATRRVLLATGEKAIKIEVLSAVRRAVGESEAGHGPQTAKDRLLVTGASGFIGSAVVNDLMRNYHVLTPGHQEIDLKTDSVLLDILVKEKGVGTILHLANPRVYTTNDSLGAALVMLKNVLDVCVENSLFFVYLSGCEIYSGYRAKELRADEALTPRPGGTYGQAKFLSEKLIEQYHTQYGLTYTLLRSCPVYGPGSDRPRFIWNFLQKAVRNEVLVPHRYINGFPTLDLLHVDDLRKAICSALEYRPGGAINLGTGVGTSTTDIAKLIVELVGSKSEIQHLEVEGYASNIVMDIRRAGALLGWHPAVELKRGLGALVRSAMETKAP